MSMQKLEILLTGSLGVLSLQLVSVTDILPVLDMVMKLGVSGVTLFLLIRRSRKEDEENKFKNEK